ncbi:hypothetical protein COOONC_08754, partial [Cooperia oncophora]
MSYLSPLPHYPTPRLSRARSYVHVPAPFPFDDELWDPRHRLLHPLHSYPKFMKNIHTVYSVRTFRLMSTILPSGGWKATQTQRRNNNSTPTSSDKARPAVDSAALQHAAARLRKTGYYEQIRGDVPNLSDGRVDGSHQRLPDGNRPYGSQLNQLERDPPREQVYAAPTHSYHTDSIGNVRGNSNSSVITHNAAVEPVLPSSFDAVPKNLYQTFNNPSSKAFIENKLELPPPQRNVLNPASPRPYTPPVTQYENQSYHTTSYIQEPIAYAPPHHDPKPYAPRPWSPRSHSAQHSTIPYNENSTYNYQTYTKETTRREEQQKTRPSTVQWETPCVRSSSPILDPHARIREFATNTYIQPEPPRSQEYVHTVRRETHSTRNAPNDFATTLRNQGVVFFQACPWKKSKEMAVKYRTAS